MHVHRTEPVTEVNRTAGLTGLFPFLLTNHQGLRRTCDPGYGNHRPRWAWRTVSFGYGVRCSTIDAVDLENRLIFELKSVEAIKPIHEAQLLTYMKLADVKIGLLINFNNTRLKDGIKRFVLWFLRALRVLRGGINE